MPTVNGGLRINAPFYTNIRSGKVTGGRSAPYDSVGEALLAIPEAYRFEGFEFKVKENGKIITYAFTANYAAGEVQALTNETEMNESTQPTIKGTRTELLGLRNSSSLEKGRLYEITDTENYGIILEAISDSRFSLSGKRIQNVPATYAEVNDSHGNEWRGIWNPDGTYEADQLVIWGGRVWKSVAGLTGEMNDEVTLNMDWLIVSPTGFNNHEYLPMQFDVGYDIDTNWLMLQMDGAGNIMGTSQEVIDATFGFTFNPANHTDWNLGTAGIPFNRNKAMGILNNRTDYGIFGNHCINGIIGGNRNAGGIYNNWVPEGITGNTTIGPINDNMVNQIADNMAPCGAIQANKFSGYIAANSNNGSISFNVCGGDITFNSNNGPIFYNRNGGLIIENSNNGRIEGNMNGGNINGNSFNGFIAINYNTGNIEFLTGSTGGMSVQKCTNMGDVGPLAVTANVTDTPVHRTSV